MTCRKRRDDVKTGVESLSRDQRGGDPLTARAASGIKVARVRSWLERGTWEPVASMLREEPKWKPHEGQSTDAGHRGGWARSVCWAAFRSGGLKSLDRPDEGRHIQRRG